MCLLAPARALAAAPSFAGSPAVIDGMSVPAKVDGPALALARGGAFERRFWPGVNLGSTIPGHQPGEVAPARADYDRWLAGMGDLGVRVVRIYTILRPSFYDALADYNAAHPQAPIRFIQGVWLPDEERWYSTGDAYDRAVTDSFRSEIADAVAVVHGDATLPERPGHAGGSYRSDVARWLLAWSPGIEWDPSAVASTNAANSLVTRYDGRFISSAEGSTPMESWIAARLDELAQLESGRGWSRPISFTNWLTADPLRHPEEPYGNEDSVSVDATHLRATAAWPGGFFASYHAYPYYPEYLRLQPSYQSYRRPRDGVVDPYAGYLDELRRHHSGQAVMITEVGVPTGNGIAHLGPLGRDQGDHSEQEQGRIDADLMRDIADEGYAGAVLFEWTDEWFKGTWNTQDTEIPRDRRQLWRNVLTNEEQFGLIASEPGKKAAVVLDGQGREWKSNRSKRLLISSRAGEVRTVPDAAYLHLLVRPARKGAFTIGLDVRPGNGGGLPATRKLDPRADVALRIGPGRRATIVRAGFADPTLWQWGLGEGMLPVNAADLKAGSGKWFAPSLVLNRPYTIPTTGERRAPELKDLGALPWGTAAKDVRNLAAGSGSGVVELRIPWALLGFADPSQRSVFVPRADGSFGTQTVRSIGVSVVPAGGKLARGRRIALRGWDSVDFHERRKAGWPTVKRAFAELAAR